MLPPLVFPGYTMLRTLMLRVILLFTYKHYWKLLQDAPAATSILGYAESNKLSDTSSRKTTLQTPSPSVTLKSHLRSRPKSFAQKFRPNSRLAGMGYSHAESPGLLSIVDRGEGAVNNCYCRLRRQLKKDIGITSKNWLDARVCLRALSQASFCRHLNWAK